MGTEIVVQIFWLSFVAIGWVVVDEARRHKLIILPEKIRLNPLILLFIYFAFGVVIFVPLVVLCYLFNLPVLVVGTFYLLLLAFTVVRSVVPLKKRALLNRLFKKPQLSWLSVIAAASLIFDFIGASIVKGAVNFDVPAQLAKINLFVATGRFSFNDPFFSNNGVSDVRYSTNLLNALYSVIAKLIHASALSIWLDSYGFFRIVMWLSLFSLIWIILDRNKYQKRWSYTILALSPFVLSTFFTYVQLPDRIILAWTALLICGLWLWLNQQGGSLLIVGAILIAATHTLNSLITLIFLVSLSFLLVLAKAVKLKRLMPITIAIPILMLPIVLNLSHSDNINNNAATFNAAAISNTFSVGHWMGWSVARLPSFSRLYLVIFCIGLISLYLLNRFSMPKLLRLTFTSLLVLMSILTYEFQITSLLVYGYLFKNAKTRAIKICLGLILVYFGLFIYNPVFITLTGKHLPPWLISRFGDFNVIALLAIVIGPLALLELAYKNNFFPRINKFLPILTPLVVLIVIWAVYPLQLSTVYADSRYRINQAQNIKLEQLNRLRAVLSGQVIYSNNSDLLFDIPTVIKASVIYINPTNASPSSNTLQRTECYKAISKSYNLSDMEAAGITRIIGVRAESAEGMPIKPKPFMKLLTNYGNYVVYSVPTVAGVSTVKNYSVCHIIYGQ